MKVKLAKIIDRFIILPICYLLAPIALFNSNKLENPKDIAIIRLWAIGESTLTLPMIKRIKLKYPNAKITIICSDKNKELFENQKFVDRVTDYKSKEILKSYRKYDVIIDAEPFLNISALLSSLLGKSSIGYSQKKSSFLYKNKIEYKDGIHVANNFIRLASPLNIKGDELETLEQIKTNEEVSKKIDELVKNIKKPRVGICITTGGTALSRRWPINKWAEISKYLFREFKANIFIIGG
ncbi:MAG: glycosyltransferase family 9 protein, partial [Candidatus Thorarchaeota archaeon]